MRKRIILAAIAGTIFAMYVQAVPVHGKMEHGGMHMDESMARQHRMMAMYAQAQAKINESLQKRDAKTVGAETRKILATIPDLKKARPHKNLKERTEMVRIAAAFENDLKTTVARSSKGDLVGARKAFNRAEEKCAACHAKFRD